MKTTLLSFGLILTTVHCTVVEIQNGQLIGSYNGKYHSFLGIPFGQPPIGVKRFESPIAYTTKWTGIRNATAPSVACVQFSNLVSSVGVEDCLVLNVFTPDINPKQPYPVRVFLYGGAFMFGAAGTIAEQYVVQQNMILVIPNYRVGPLGFLSSGDNLISGNFGLKDQQLAMKWVQENIHAFGGDHRQVVLTGVSSGGACVHAHLLNENSCPYFSGAMSSSAVITDNFVMQSYPKKQFQKFIQNIGCDLTNRADVKQCLLNSTVDELVKATDGLKLFRDNPINVFGIVREPKGVQDAFLIESPRKLIRRGKICDIPWVVAHSEREGTVTAAEFLSLDEDGNELIGILNKRWFEIAPVVLFYYNTNAIQRNSYSEYLRIKYMEGQDFSVNTYPRLEKMFKDVVFLNGIKEAIDLHRKHGKAPLYEYEYRKPLRYGFGNVFSNRSDINFGADHASDVTFILPTRRFEQIDAITTTNDKFVAKNLIDMSRELCISGIAKYDSRELPINTATQTGKLIIYDSYYVIESHTRNGQYVKNVYNNTT